MDEEQEAIAAKGAAAALPDNFPLAAKLQEAREGDEDAQADLARYGMWPEMERLDDKDDVVMMEVEGGGGGS
jgi:2-polyprenyl-6-methoxyphenol hydroxylase-like FAD-dependent oxidoreductase